MEYFLIALVSTPFLVGIAIILYKTLDFVVAALIILRDFLEDLSLLPHFSWDTTCGPWFFQDADGNINGMVIYYERQKEQRYFDLPDEPSGEAILDESRTRLLS